MGFLKSIIERVSAKEAARPSKYPDRNDPCWCGSGLKYKKCHLRKDWEGMKGCSANCGPT